MPDKSLELFKKAKKLMPGGVNSPVRAYQNVDNNPPFIAHAEGAYITDVDNRRYIDFVCSYGAILLGHNHPIIREAIIQAVHAGTSFGAPTAQEVEIARFIQSLVPSVEMSRLVNSGTEATLSAIRLAKGYTQKDKILKFTGCYHGHSDGLLVKAGSGAMTCGIPDSLGVPATVAHLTLVAPFNDTAAVSALMAEHGQDIAAIIVEPIVGNMNLILPEKDFLQTLRQLCDQHQSLLIFDEVMTGFRVALQGAQGLYQITPDLSCFGKVIGGGLPVGAFGGKRAIMEFVAPVGPVYQAGTLSGNPITVSAGLAALRYLQTHPESYQQLSHMTGKLIDGLANIASDKKIPLSVKAVGGMFGFQFQNDPEHYLFKQFFNGMLQQGIFLPPSPYETCFITLQHNETIIEKTLTAAATVFKKL